MHTHEPAIRHRIGLHAGPRALAPATRRALRSLGYALVAPDERAAAPVRLWLVDERSLDRIPGPEVEPATPLVLLSGARPGAVSDPRVVGRVARPADARSLFEMLQRALEPHPRRVPRVSTALPARCIRSDRRWPGALLSLSEGGCLLRSSELVDVGERLNLQFALPGGELVTARARCLYRGGDRTGLAFTHPSALDLERIRGYVSQHLAAA